MNIYSIFLSFVFFAREQTSPKIACQGIYIQQHYNSPFPFISHSFVYSRRCFLYEPSCDSTCIISCKYSFCDILQCHVKMFAALTVHFYLPLYSIYYCAHIYHSCSAFPWFQVRITPFLILFFHFDWIAHSYYCTWLITYNELFWS